MSNLLILTPEQKKFYDENGFLHLPGFYSEDEVRALRDEFHTMITETEGRPKNMSISFMKQAEGYEIDPFNPKNVSGMMDHVLASDFWFDHFAEPRIVSVLVDLMGPNIDFHNGKVRNKPPGFKCDQSWHQDFPYERHSKPELAAALTYLDETDFEAGATEIVPGSHLKGEWESFDGTRIKDENVEEGSWVVCKAQPGDVAIISVLVVHRAGHNYTNIARHAIINEYKTMETVDQWNNRCALAGLPLARNGKPLWEKIQNR
ncbi:MAG: phytanoyl-CoA dioxygenase family protein [Planctomycetota bacterium]|nr:phytanoyl-CoA dioxygenase family protein [Planctomycetota bacterium]MDA1137553.1 phytanoyl-CoA dioxygenase family protein [Planctomycetota bacterium]